MGRGDEGIAPYLSLIHIYMRTDSLRLSDEATAAAKEFILARYGADYYPGKARVYKTKSGAQDAHEAIRPSNVNLTPEDIKKSLTAEQYKLYKLIWSRFLACQMAPAVYDSVSIEVASAGYTFRATHSALKFSGYTAVYVEGKDEEEEAFQSPLPDLKEGEALKLEAIKPDQMCIRDRMYMGRVGILSFSIAFITGNRHPAKIKYPEMNVMIG